MKSEKLENSENSCHMASEAMVHHINLYEIQANDGSYIILLVASNLTILSGITVQCNTRNEREGTEMCVLWVNVSKKDIQYLGLHGCYWRGR